MRFLLDTHTLAWAVGQPSSLSKKVSTFLEKPDSEIMVSPVSVWEMSIKHKLGKWPEVAPFMDEQLYETFLEKLSATELDVRSRHTRLAGQFDTNHKDPFDRLLAAQAVIEGVALISKDEVMSSFPIVRVW